MLHVNILLLLNYITFMYAYDYFHIIVQFTEINI
jgi:hypothetical protein